METLWNPSMESTYGDLYAIHFMETLYGRKMWMISIFYDALCDTVFRVCLDLGIGLA